ncbi:MAG TPA: GTP-binding protein, partial [Polyangiaceae bacterium]|nr:GTP-binding protein [Polyangiaceae bacterium]
MLPRTPLACVRNFGIVAHVDAGKTTLTERILHATGRIHALGSVDAGNTVTDHDPRERARGITIGAAAVTTSHAGHLISLIDTPGHIDFGVEVERSLRVLDGAVVVIDAASGVEPQTESVWATADRHEVPRIAFINKIDHPGADFDAAVSSLEETFGVVAVPLVVPAPNGLCLVDLLHLTLIEPGHRSGHIASPLPSDLFSFASARRERIVEACAAFDERVLEAFVLGEPVASELLLSALRRGTLSREIVPCLGGSAKVGLGITHLLDHIVALLPSPLDRASVQSSAGITHVPGLEAPLVAYCFKGVHDGFGQRTFVRVYSGTLRRGASVIAGRTQKRVRIGRLVRVFADSVEDLEAAYPGDIAAVIGVPLAPGETLSDEGVLLEGLDLREPVVGVALELKTNEARNRLGNALKRVLDEDPSLSISTDSETGQTVLRGQGELHLEVTLDKIRQDHGVEIKASPPRVAYRETITQSAELEVRHVKQSGGPGQFACVVIRVDPAPRGAGISFVDASDGGVVPRAFV